MFPALPYNSWKETYATLHLWTQIAGKISLKLNPLINHWWECSLRVTSRGLKTTLMPYHEYTVELEFDFIDHCLVVSKSDGGKRIVALQPKSVADFYIEVMECLNALNIYVSIDPLPSELPDPVPFPIDYAHASYDRDFAYRHWQILLTTDKLLTKFRSHFTGKASPVQFWWGSFDLVVSLFSGRAAPPRPGADHLTREAYSHEVMSCGFWPGSGNILAPAYYAYIAPEPAGFKSAKIRPAAAYYNEPTAGYILKYDDVREMANPESAVLEFFDSTYTLAADLARWDRKSLERRNLIRRAGHE